MNLDAGKLAAQSQSTSLRLRGDTSHLADHDDSRGGAQALKAVSWVIAVRWKRGPAGAATRRQTWR